MMSAYVWHSTLSVQSHWLSIVEIECFVSSVYSFVVALVVALKRSFTFSAVEILVPIHIGWYCHLEYSMAASQVEHPNRSELTEAFRQQKMNLAFSHSDILLVSLLANTNT